MGKEVAFDLGLEGWAGFQEAVRRHLTYRELQMRGASAAHMLRGQVSSIICSEHRL